MRPQLLTRRLCSLSVDQAHITFMYECKTLSCGSLRAWWQEGVGVWAGQGMLWTLNSPQGSSVWVRTVLKAFHQPPSRQLLPRHWSQTSWFLSYTSLQSLLSSPGFSEWPFQPPFPSNSPTTFPSVGGNNRKTEAEVLTPLDEVRAGVLVPDLRAVTTLPGRSTPCPHFCEHAHVHSRPLPMSSQSSREAGKWPW